MNRNVNTHLIVWAPSHIKLFNWFASNSVCRCLKSLSVDIMNNIICSVYWYSSVFDLLNMHLFGNSSCHSVSMPIGIAFELSQEVFIHLEVFLSFSPSKDVFVASFRFIYKKIWITPLQFLQIFLVANYAHNSATYDYFIQETSILSSSFNFLPSVILFLCSL